MNLIETIERKRREVMKKQKATGEGNLTGLQNVANEIAKKRKGMVPLMEKRHAK